MSKITTFSDRKQQAQLQTRLAAEFARIESEFGVKLSFKGGSFSSNELTMRVNAKILNEDGSTVSEREKMYLQQDNVPYGSQLLIKGKTYTVSGYNITKPKNSIRITGADGRQYNCSSQTARVCMVK